MPPPPSRNNLESSLKTRVRFISRVLQRPSPASKNATLSGMLGLSAVAVATVDGHFLCAVVAE